MQRLATRCAARKRTAGQARRVLSRIVLTMYAAWCGLSLTFACAAEFSAGKKAITLVSADGARLDIGHAVLTPDGDATGIAVTLDAPQFGDEFLSMRPFRCLPDPKEMWCYLAYPYKTHGRITADNLVDLEYALLFLWRSPAKVGIDAWNGLYFKLALTGDGAIAGDLHEADFNVLAVPPDDLYSRPVTHDMLSKADPASHRFSRVEIR